jgi:hypothetical protein
MEVLTSYWKSSRRKITVKVRGSKSLQAGIMPGRQIQNINF